MSNLNLIPTTKAKQRALVDALIDAAATNQLPKYRLLRCLRVLRRQLHNRRRAPPGRITAPATPLQRQRIMQMHRMSPELSMQEISHRLRVSIGRVSETLSGKRK
jgi:hypothetical protein